MKKLISVGLLKMLNAALSIFNGVLIARLLGAENLGLYTFVISIVTVICLPILAGIPPLIVREAALAKVNQDFGLIKGLLVTIHLFIFTFSVVVLSIILLAFNFDLLTNDSSSNECVAYSMALLLTAVTAVSSVRSSVLKGIGNPVMGSLPEFLIRPISMMVILLSIIIFKGTVTYIEIIFYGFISALIGFLIGYIFQTAILGKKLKVSKSRFRINEWIKRLLPLSYFSGIKQFDKNLLFLMLGFLSQSSEVGVLKVAVSAIPVLSIPLMAANTILAPKIVEGFSDKQRIHVLQGEIRNTMNWVFLVTLILVFMLYFWGDVFIIYFFGAEFQEVHQVLLIMSLGQLVNCACGPAGNMFIMTGYERVTNFPVSIAVVVSLLASLILIPSHGALGSALAYTLSLSFWNIYLLIRAHAMFGILPCIGFRFR